MSTPSARSVRRLVVPLVAVLCMLGAAPAHGRPPDTRGLATALVTRLRAQTGLRPETHATDFGDDAIGCLTFPQWELRRFGYPGHAFACEEGATHEVLGAVVNRAGVVRCYIHGAATDDDCFDLTICDDPIRVCTQ